MPERNIPRRGNTAPSAEQVTNSPEQTPAPNAAMQEFADKFSSISEQIDGVVASKRATTKEYETNLKLAPHLVKKYGGENIYHDKIVGHNQQIADLQNKHRALSKLYDELGGSKIDNLKQELQDRTSGRARGTWSAEAVITERALRQAQDAFAKNHEDYKANKQKRSQSQGAPSSPRSTLPPAKKGPEGGPASNNEPEGQSSSGEGGQDDPVNEARKLVGDALQVLNNPNTSPENKATARAAIQAIVEALDVSAPKGGGEGNQRPSAERINDSMTRMNECFENTYEVDPDTGEKRYSYREHIEQHKEARENFLEVMARKQKGHGLRARPDGKLVSTLYGCGRLGAKLAGYLTRPSKEEQQAAAAYEAALAQVDADRRDFLSREINDGNLTEEEVRGIRGQFFATEHHDNVQEIARLQMDYGKDENGKRRRPMSKWLRRLGYVSAGAVGGLTAIFSLPLGLAVAGAGAGAFRYLANKRNANTKAGPRDKNPFNREHKAEAVADVYHQQFLEAMQARAEVAEQEGSDWEPGAGDIVDRHIDETSTEVGKRVRKFAIPVLGALGAALATKFSIEALGSGAVHPVEQTPTTQNTTAESVVDASNNSNLEPVDHFTEVTTNGAPEGVVGDQLQHLGYKFEKGDSTDLLGKIAEKVGQNNVFVDDNGNPVNMFTGRAGDQQFGAWNVDTSVRFSDEAVQALKDIKGVSKI
mgnify:FL=1